MKSDALLALTRPRTQAIIWLQLSCTAIALVFGPRQDPRWWLLSLGVYFLTGCLGITITFHRFLTHRSFRMPPWAERLFSVFGALGGTGSPIGWVAVHRQHHAHSDTALDPHSPKTSGWRVLIGGYNFEFNKWSVRRLITDPFHVALHNYYHLWLALWALALWLVSPNAFVFGFAAPVAIQLWVSNLSNYLNHHSGYRNFETKEASTNHALVALVSFGEGWHNNHHRYPTRWNFQVKWWELDMSAWIIRAFGWAPARKTES